VLVDAGQIGRGATGSSAGWVGDDPGVSFADLENAIGLRAARRAWQAWHRAALDFAALLRRLNINCDLQSCGSLTIALTPEQLNRLRREQKVRQQADLEAPFLSGRIIAGEVALPAAGGIRAREGATIDPYRAAIGLAAAAVQRGARLFERSAVAKIKFTRRIVDVYPAGGAIRAARVIVATGFPTMLFKGLRRHFWFRQRYFALTAPIPAKMRQALGKRQAVVRDLADPPHVLRWLHDERLLVAGADAESPPERQRDKVIVQRTGQLMYELSTLYPEISGIAPEYGWDAAYVRTADGLPYIGPHRNYPHHLFAFGDSSHGVAGAYLASRILLRHHLEQVEPADEGFRFRL
jgi:glycine/D-amino acid oxidase-like deaminating enzyme